MTAGPGAEGLTPEQLERRERAIQLTAAAFADIRAEYRARAAAA